MSRPSRGSLFARGSTLGPLVLMVIKMLSRDVLPFLAMYSCFFAMTLSWLWGIYAGMDGPATSVWDVCVLLFRYTINPDTSYFTLLGSSAGDDTLFAIAGGVQAVWLVLSNVVRVLLPTLRPFAPAHLPSTLRTSRLVRPPT